MFRGLCWMEYLAPIRKLSLSSCNFSLVFSSLKGTTSWISPIIRISAMRCLWHLPWTSSKIFQVFNPLTRKLVKQATPKIFSRRPNLITYSTKPLLCSIEKDDVSEFRISWWYTASKRRETSRYFNSSDGPFRIVISLLEQINIIADHDNHVFG